MNTYERKCPVCGEKFITKHVAKRFCCADCVAEYDDIKRYMYQRIKKIILPLLQEARETNKPYTEMMKEFAKKW